MIAVSVGDPGSGKFLIPGSGIQDLGFTKTYGSGSGTLVKKYKKIAGIWTN
jgi:hypothetical protein